MTEVTLGADDLVDVEVRVRMRVRVSGAIHAPGDGLSLTDLRVLFFAELLGERHIVEVDNRGLFVFPKLQAGRYSVILFGQAPRHFFISEIALNGVAVQDNVLEIPETESNVEIRLRANGGIVYGKVGRKLARQETALHPQIPYIVLFPLNTKQRDRIQFAPVRTDGTCELRGVAPGDYWALLVEADESSSIHNFMLWRHQYHFEEIVAEITQRALALLPRGGASRVSVGAGASVFVELR